MTPLRAPLVDARTEQDLVGHVEYLLQLYTARRPGADTNQLRQALIGVFARFGALVINRLNQVPDKAFLAFLDLVGLELLPPQPARVPLTFHLVSGAGVDALVPARTWVAGQPLEGDTSPVIFETNQELVVTRTQLVAAFSREPSKDRYSDHTAIITGQRDGPPISLFRGHRQVEHWLYLGYQDLLGLDTPDRTLTLTLTLSSSETADNAWLHAIDWFYWSGSRWIALSAPTLASIPDPWTLTFTKLPSIPVTTLQGQTSRWLGGRLNTALPPTDLDSTSAQATMYTLQGGDLLPDLAYSASSSGAPTLWDVSKMIPLFGSSGEYAVFYLASDSIFSKPGAKISLSVKLDRTKLPIAAGLGLAWEYWNGSSWSDLSASIQDGTQAFTQDGSITFNCPVDWSSSPAASLPADKNHYWLRVRVSSGSYQSFPIIQQFRLAYTWTLSSITAIDAHIQITGATSLDSAATNSQPIDLTKDFYPFGEKPAFNDTFYLASALFAWAGASITLTVEMSSNAVPTVTPSVDLRLEWEYWNGVAWVQLGGLTDNTGNFVKAATVTFSCPQLEPLAVNGQPGYWLRVRIVQGNYGQDVQYTKNKNGDGYVLSSLATYTPPSINSINVRCDYTSTDQLPDYVVTENDFTVRHYLLPSQTNPVPRFLPGLDTQPAFYLGFTGPDGESGFGNRVITLYFQVVPLQDAPLPSADAEEEPAVVIWEYWNGTGWARLVTSDETQGFILRGLVTFIAPADFWKSQQFGQTAFWLRAHWDHGSYTALPRVQRVLTNTTWATQTLSVQNEVLGSSNGKERQVFTTARSPLLPGQQITVCEPDVPSAHERRRITHEEGTDAITILPDASGQPAQVWVRWHEVADFYGSGPRSRHYLLDRIQGRITFGDNVHGLVPPVGQNNVRAAWYQAGGGPQGNRPSGNLSQLKTTIPYVDGVTNIEPAMGGAEQESVDALKARGPRTLRHRDRAVTAADFEDLCLTASPEVLRAKALGEPGTVILLILPRSTGPLPTPSPELIDRVQAFIQARMSPTVSLQVEAPQWRRVAVTAEVVPVAIASASEVQTAVLVALAAYLHPLTGGGSGAGWDFGAVPHRSDLAKVAGAVRGVDHVRWLTVQVESVSSPARSLIYSGTHTVTMNSELIVQTG